MFRLICSALLSGEQKDDFVCCDQILDSSVFWVSESWSSCDEQSFSIFAIGSAATSILESIICRSLSATLICLRITRRSMEPPTCFFPIPASNCWPSSAARSDTLYDPSKTFEKSALRSFMAASISRARANSSTRWSSLALPVVIAIHYL